MPRLISQFCQLPGVYVLTPLGILPGAAWASGCPASCRVVRAAPDRIPFHGLPVN